MIYLARFLSGVGLVCLLATAVVAYLYFTYDGPPHPCKPYVAKPGVTCRPDRNLVTNGVVAICSCPSRASSIQ